jgi:hypothetical protein
VRHVYNEKEANELCDGEEAKDAKFRLRKLEGSMGRRTHSSVLSGCNIIRCK